MRKRSKERIQCLKKSSDIFAIFEFFPPLSSGNRVNNSVSKSWRRRKKVKIFLSGPGRVKRARKREYFRIATSCLVMKRRACAGGKLRDKPAITSGKGRANQDGGPRKNWKRIHPLRMERISCKTLVSDIIYMREKVLSNSTHIASDPFSGPNGNASRELFGS